MTSGPESYPGSQVPATGRERWRGASRAAPTMSGHAPHEYGAERRASALVRARSVDGDSLERDGAALRHAIHGNLLDGVRSDLTQEQLRPAGHVHVDVD